MLKRLSITNYLLIEALELDLQRGLTIITGETGSGKSILIGALALAMGDRVEAGTQRDPSKRSVIELEVDLNGVVPESWFAQAEIPLERYTILRRQWEANGRSRAFVNDTPLKLEQLRELGEKLVHVHSQHHTLLLNDPRFQLGLVDDIAGQREAVDAYQVKYAEWRKGQRALADLLEQERREKSELDFLLFQLEELDEAHLVVDEQAGIEAELTRADHAEELLRGLRTVEEGITSERGISAMMTGVRQTLAKAARLDPAIHALLDRLISVHIELKDIGDEADRLTALITVDPMRAAQMRERLDMLLRLQQKHRAGSTEELVRLREDMRARVQGIGSLSVRVSALQEQDNTASAEVQAAATALSKERATALGPLASKVETVLRELGMPNASFRFEHAIGEPGPQGIDSLRALFSANKDRAPAALDKVASGGELSRVMLALISLAADSQDLPTVIFDEIDTGVSGEVADRVGSLLANMGGKRQVLAITHLPQIASKAHTHLLVAKEERLEGVHTTIRTVQGNERIEALAQMLSGRKLTKAALQNARELLKADT